MARDLPDGLRYRFPRGTNVPTYISSECGSRYFVERNKIYDTDKLPASLYLADDDRYVVGDDPGHEGGDLWATDAALDMMDNEDWSGMFVSLPGVDKAAHMWGGVNDPGPAGADGDPKTHMEYAAETADAQVGRIMDALEASGELDNTLVVLTADHGSVGTTTPPTAGPGDHFHGTYDPELNYGFYNWYYGDVENDVLPRRRNPRCSRWSTPTTSACPTATPRSTSGCMDQSRPRRTRPPGSWRTCPTSPRCGATTATTSRWSRRSAGT